MDPENNLVGIKVLKGKVDPNNKTEFCAKEKSDYWGQVDLYIGGAEHAVGHLLYSRFWTKFLYDRGMISFEEPFKKMISKE